MIHVMLYLTQGEGKRLSLSLITFYYFLLLQHVES